MEKISIDLSPVFVELAKIQGLLRAYASVTLDEEQKKKLDELYPELVGKAFRDLLTDFPHLLTDTLENFDFKKSQANE